MAVTNYYSVNGTLLGEKSTGGNRVDYLSDALGSVTATVDNSAQVVNTYRYKPYGTQLAKTGAGSDPAFTWVGQWGYRQTARQFSDVYVRARHYSCVSGRWTTIDPLGLGAGLNRFSYVNGEVVGAIDPSGMLKLAVKFATPIKKSGGSFDSCGEQWVQWINSTDKEPGVRGVWVQHVRGIRTGKTCNGQPQEAQTVQFWEGVELPARWASVADDNRLYTESGIGRIDTCGEARFYTNPSVIQTVLKWKKGCGNPRVTMTSNHCTETAPDFWKESKGNEVIAVHFVALDYTCCICPEKTTMTATWGAGVCSPVFWF